MGYETIAVATADHIATLTLSRPDSLNALNKQMATELLDAISGLARNDDVRVVVVTGAGRAFAAGKDLQETLNAPEDQKVPIDWPEKACYLFRSIDKPTIASINGAAVGFGFALCLACDIRIAAETARMGMGFLGVAMTPGFGATYFLPHLLGLGRACDLALTGRMVGAREAEALGLVSKVVAAPDLKRATDELASTLARSAPVALRLTKQALYHGLESSLSSQLRFETSTQEICSGTADHREAMKAFLEKREPAFRGE